jgi:pimeloyl-ACP methyl ester carboxylesterase
MRHSNLDSARHRVSPLATVALLGMAIATGCTSAAPQPAGSSGAGASRTVAATGPATASEPSQSLAAASIAPAEVTLLKDVEVAGGRSIHVSCLGTSPVGVPTVVFVSGLGAPAEAANPIFYDVAKLTRICAYDRPGLGQSPPVTDHAPTASEQAADLRAALDGAGIDGPYVFVGHSYAAYVLALLAQAAPDDIAGLVFADPRSPRVSARWLAALPPMAAGEVAVVAANRDELTRGESDPSLNPEGVSLAASGADASAALDEDGPLFGDRPVIVLSAGQTKEAWAGLPADLREAFDRIWLEEQRALTKETTKGEFRTLAESDHDVVGRDPEAVVGAIKDVLEALDSGG